MGGAASTGRPAHHIAMTTGSPTTTALDGRAQPAVDLVGITKAFRASSPTTASRSVSGGEVHCLLGENGAGKSTLMNILSGMLRPGSGEIRLEGRSVEIHSPKHAIELGIGMVYQHTSLVPQLTVLENLMLGEEESASTRPLRVPGWPTSAARSGSTSTPRRRRARSRSASSSSSRSSRPSGAARRC